MEGDTKQEDQPQRVVVVSYGKSKYTIDTTAMETVGDLKARLAELANVEMHNQKLLHKSRQLQDDTELSDLKLRKRTTMMLVGTQQSQVEQLKKTEQKFEARERALAKRGAVVTTSPMAAQEMLFGALEPLPDSGDPAAPPASAALDLLKRLAADPNIYAIMKKHNWRVGILKEFAPSLETGIVGVTDSCLLGYNQNKGQVIALRLRTDDFEGFRHYHVIIQTLLHELAHMVHSKHDRKFWDLFRQLRKEYDELHWTKSGGRQLQGASSSTTSSASTAASSSFHPHTGGSSSTGGTQTPAFAGTGHTGQRLGGGTAPLTPTPTPTRTATATAARGSGGGGGRGQPMTAAEAARAAALRRLQHTEDTSTSAPGVDGGGRDDAGHVNGDGRGESKAKKHRQGRTGGGSDGGGCGDGDTNTTNTAECRVSSNDMDVQCDGDCSGRGHVAHVDVSDGSGGVGGSGNGDEQLVVRVRRETRPGEITPERREEIYRNAMLAEMRAVGPDPFTYRPRRSVKVGKEYQAVLPDLLPAPKPDITDATTRDDADDDGDDGDGGDGGGQSGVEINEGEALRETPVSLDAVVVRSRHRGGGVGGSIQERK
ncbi:hypothetical protein PTSG_03256 [Salpingoeca rosetta]|uniref:WLM domain-containing protein n=1 Tax=Salpingoeca rosetta (strain ATCC 50818 / BSB-021) TaxID=946362 RepID=F2U4N6_SALR5|nr:uncharacterized protein PTSG_03256 [Salpingoeca rosetta]EGD82602.1 hypothetical protein PTSG_03256 [Salpingoeca rosetta]|eukprot:XP_004995838.1 hypothetical protein PTSG_03256 [Salpingoeca rosetta]